MKICIHPTCDRAASCKGYCAAHYQRHKRGADMDAPIKEFIQSGLCSVPHCENKHFGLGMCKKHYNRHKQHGDVGVGRKQRSVCRVDGCQTYAHAHGLCQMHGARVKKYGDASYEKPIINKGKTCSHPGCENPSHARSLCPTHRAKHHQETAAGRPCPDYCEICGNPEIRPNSSRLCWDHDHATGKFRGWICHACNVALGKARDNPGLLRKMADYVEAGGITA